MGLTVDRRMVLRLAAGAAAASAMVSRAGEGEGLALRAARRGLNFGCMVSAADVDRDSPVAPLILADAAMIVPQNELKWRATENREGHPDYSGADKISAFAKRNGLEMRGHTAFWYGGNPDWVKPELGSPVAMTAILRRVHDVVKRFRGRVTEWDVVNEAIEPKDELPGFLRRAPFGRAMDAGYIADCFHAARDADPSARLYYNDYAVEYNDPEQERRRRGVLDLLTELKRRNAPIDGLGIQSHLAYGWRYDAEIFRAFLAKVAAMGLAIRLTELDVADYKAAADIGQRDRQTAEHARRYLETAFDEQAVVGVMCWGLSDKNTWLRSQKWAQNPGGSPERPLPYDDQMQRKPMWDAIGAALDNAPMRHKRQSALPRPLATR